jgi:Na+-transporting methylmalonyl-CoA/oxaloacetate decarboxylase gamma subunit
MAISVFAGPLRVFGTLSEHPRFVDSIAFQLNGLIVVFAALCSIWILMEIIGFFFKRAEARKKAAILPHSGEAVATETPPVEAPDEVPAPVMAIIAASVAMTFQGRPHRIEAITPEHAVDWAREGRRQIFASHRVR